MQFSLYGRLHARRSRPRRATGPGDAGSTGCGHEALERPGCTREAPVTQAPFGTGGSGAADRAGHAVQRGLAATEPLSDELLEEMLFN